jgi:hypothetical protein
MSWLKALAGAGVGAAVMKRRQERAQEAHKASDTESGGERLDMRLRPGRDLQLEVILAPRRQVEHQQVAWLLLDPDNAGTLRVDDESGALLGWVSPRLASFAGNLLNGAFAAVVTDIPELRGRTPHCLVQLTVEGTPPTQNVLIGLEIPVVVDNPHA